ncbi:MAG: V-type ATPase subunit a family protein [archaeon]|nr:V-type ATPase subunit a family protein [archaeon]
MGEIFRSKDMVLVNIFISYEAAHDVVDELAKAGAIQFRDLNPGTNAFHRNFVNDVTRIDQLAKRLETFQEKMIEHGIRDDFYYAEPDIRADEMLNDGTNLTVLAEMENQFEDLTHELTQLDQYQTATRRDITAAIEEKNVLQRAHESWLVGAEGVVKDEDEEIHLLGGDQRSSNLTYIAGVMKSDDMNAFRRVLWRVTHGNLFMRDDEIDERIPDPRIPDKLVVKTAFIIFSQGEVAQSKIRKMCEAFSASIFNVSSNPAHREAQIGALERRIEDLRRVSAVNIRRTADILSNTILPRFDAWRCRVLKEKLIYHTMNLFDYDIQRTTLIAEGWVPTERLQDVSDALKCASEKARALVEPVLHVIETRATPPTYIPTNKYTAAFQNIVDSYGVPRYQEVNPASFTIVSFPFLFGVMFGDVGHGTFLLFFALWLIWKEQELARVKLNELIATCFTGRYVLVLMAIFSIYMGLLYNECFAVPMNLFGVQFFKFGGENTYLYPYPLGVNPVWKVAENTLNYYNSLKMKMSIVIGVIHMTFGIILSAFNGRFFRHHWEHKYDIIFVFIPQMVFFLSIFGYMTFLIIFKWSVNWLNIEGYEAPKLLSLMISMFQSVFQLKSEYSMFYGQQTIQQILVLLALISVPIMLFPKPYLLRRDWRNAHADWREREAAKDAGKAYIPGKTVEFYKATSTGLDASSDPLLVLPIKASAISGPPQYIKLVDELTDEDNEHDAHDAHDAHDHAVAVTHHEEEEDDFDFGEIFVHQMIHTIEFVLGAISNTASYLRLWALSLAHSELSEVFLERVALLSLTIFNPIAPWIGFGAWAGLTWAVLLGMESVSAFLHALRLHWVEFQNKFFQGTGHPFEPVSHFLALQSLDD